MDLDGYDTTEALGFFVEHDDRPVDVALAGEGAWSRCIGFRHDGVPATLHAIDGSPTRPATAGEPGDESLGRWAMRARRAWQDHR